MFNQPRPAFGTAAPFGGQPAAQPGGGFGMPVPQPQMGFGGGQLPAAQGFGAPMGQGLAPARPFGFGSADQSAGGFLTPANPGSGFTMPASSGPGFAPPRQMGRAPRLQLHTAFPSNNPMQPGFTVPPQNQSNAFRPPQLAFRSSVQPRPWQPPQQLQQAQQPRGPRSAGARPPKSRATPPTSAAAQMEMDSQPAANRERERQHAITDLAKKKKIFVSGPVNTSMDVLKAHFAQFGEVVKVQALAQKDGTKMGAVVTFSNPEQAQAALFAPVEVHLVNSFQLKPFQGGGGSAVPLASAPPPSAVPAKKLNAQANPFVPASKLQKPTRARPKLGPKPAKTASAQDSMDIDADADARQAAVEDAGDDQGGEGEDDDQGEGGEEEDEEEEEGDEEGEEEEEEGDDAEQGEEEEEGAQGEEDDATAEGDNAEEEPVARAVAPSARSFPPPRSASVPAAASAMGGGDEDESDCVVGTCTLMCPAAEAADREPELLEAFHPALNNTGELMVKKLKRSAAMQNRAVPEDVRNVETLDRTAGYLWKEILDIDSRGPDPRFIETVKLSGQHDTPMPSFVYAFVCDRTRQIRKDFSVQGYASTSPTMPFSPITIKVYEECARFHINAGHEFCDGSQEGYVDNLNRKELNDSLKSLNDLYVRGRRLGHTFPNEAEMRSYYILVNLLADHSERVSINMHIASLLASSPDVANHPLFVQSLELYNAFLSGDYNYFFSLLRSEQTSFLTACLMHSAFIPARMHALDLINGACHKPKLLALSRIQEWLCFNDVQEAQQFCEHAGLEVENGNVKLGVQRPLDMDGGLMSSLKTLSTVVLGKKGSLSRFEVVADASRTGGIARSLPSSVYLAEAMQAERERRAEKERAEALAREETAKLAKERAQAEAEQHEREKRAALEREAVAKAAQRAQEEETVRAKAAQAEREAEAERQRQREAARLEAERAKAEAARREEERLRALEREAREREQREEEQRRLAEVQARERERVLQEERARAARTAALERQRRGVEALEARRRRGVVSKALVQWKAAASASAKLRGQVRALVGSPLSLNRSRTDDADLPLDAKDEWNAPLPFLSALLDATAPPGTRIIVLRVVNLSSVARFSEWVANKLKDGRGTTVQLIVDVVPFSSLPSTASLGGYDGELRLCDVGTAAAAAAAAAATGSNLEFDASSFPPVATMTSAKLEMLARAVGFFAAHVPQRPRIARFALESLALRVFPVYQAGRVPVLEWLREGNAQLRQNRPVVAQGQVQLLGWPTPSAHAALPDVVPPPGWSKLDLGPLLLRCAVPETDDLNAFCKLGGVSWLAELRARAGGDSTWLWNQACAACIMVKAREHAEPIWAVDRHGEEASSSGSSTITLANVLNDAPVAALAWLPSTLDAEPSPAASPLLSAEIKAAQNESRAFENELLGALGAVDIAGDDHVLVKGPQAKPRSLKRALDDAWKEAKEAEARLKLLVGSDE